MNPNLILTLPGLALSVLGILILAISLPSHGLVPGGLATPWIRTGEIFAVVGANSLLIGFAAHSYTTALGMTSEDGFLYFYRRYLTLETCIACAGVLILAGIALDYAVMLFPTDGLNRIDLSAMAQTLIIVGANAGLVGALCSLLGGRLDGR